MVIENTWAFGFWLRCIRFDELSPTATSTCMKYEDGGRGSLFQVLVASAEPMVAEGGLNITWKWLKSWSTLKGSVFWQRKPKETRTFSGFCLFSVTFSPNNFAAQRSGDAQHRHLRWSLWTHQCGPGTGFVVLCRATGAEDPLQRQRCSGAAQQLQDGWDGMVSWLSYTWGSPMVEAKISSFYEVH